MVDETERGWVLWIEYGLFALLCAVEFRLTARRRARDANPAALSENLRRMVHAGSKP